MHFSLKQAFFKVGAGWTAQEGKCLLHNPEDMSLVESLELMQTQMG